MIKKKIILGSRGSKLAILYAKKPKNAILDNYSDLYNNQGQYVAFPSKADEMMKSRIGVMVYSQKEDPYGNPIQKIKLDDQRTTYYSPEVQKWRKTVMKNYYEKF